MRSLAPLLTSCAVAPDVPPASGSGNVFVQLTITEAGKRRGRPIHVRLTLPVAFRLGGAATGDG